MTSDTQPSEFGDATLDDLIPVGYAGMQRMAHDRLRRAHFYAIAAIVR